ncbi:hypothetical protein [Allonocardiopsis opalescens]|uniref:Uncharacterized protein n=1 Tax=Allonocardiopsis opalescens TaxID=1144618 RepID=A0A2T0PVP4_9ACTN|nr:hypothetical protein [Allonocardiopsis opalescens]PRX95604.1 hypothetical protein CLV72_109213 [Allonocardiopsis opalescens]
MRDLVILLAPAGAAVVALTAAAAGFAVRALVERRRARAQAQAERIQWAAIVAGMDPDGAMARRALWAIAEHERDTGGAR